MAKNKGGRPTKFKKEFSQELIKFFDIEPYRKETLEKMKEYFESGKVKKESEKYQFVANKLPTLYRFSEKIGVVYSTVWRWAEKGEWNEEDGEKPLEFQEFCNAYKAAKEIQKEFLISLGLSGTTPPSSYIFTAKNVSDMRDQSNLDLTSGGEKITALTEIQTATKEILNGENKTISEEPV